MRIIITASSEEIDQPINSRFGRADYFLLFDSDTGEWESFPNPAGQSSGGAGPQAVQFISDKGADIVISGRFGPKAVSALESARIKAFIANNGTVVDVLDQYLAGQLKPIS